MAFPAAIMTVPLTPGTIQTSEVPIAELPQTTPSASGSTEGVSTEGVSTEGVPFITSTAEQTTMTHTALQCSALLYMAMPYTAMQVTPSIMKARPNQLGLFGAPSLIVQGTQFQGSYMPNPGWHLSPREHVTLKSSSMSTSNLRPGS